MKLTRLRLTGFKSFVEPTDFLIEPGLTGVVGPNGCGKSNLVEALRWVMGEASHKAMRAADMNDVIFSGSGNRPARNNAEVMLSLDNGDRTAPALFNEHDALDVSRRIDRDAGSTYRVNGREVRARDVQIIFADASTGARSPALVHQGRIGEIIQAKPAQRRRVLEEAAGISGLHARRHEAELRLNAAEQNLARLEDVIAQIASQMEALKRQSRQAVRYRTVAAELRKTEAMLCHLRWTAANVEAAEAEQAKFSSVRAVADATGAQAETAKHQAIVASTLPQLREAEAKAAAVLQRLVMARETLDREETRAKERLAELDMRISQLRADTERERRLVADADAALNRLAEEEAGLQREGSTTSERQAGAAERVTAAETALVGIEKKFTELTEALADLAARRNQLERAAREHTDRLSKIESQIRDVENELQALDRQAQNSSKLSELAAAVDAAQNAVTEAEAAALRTEAAHSAARQGFDAARHPFDEAERRAHRLETEAKTLARLLGVETQKMWPPALDLVTVEKGYETALGAALGDDLDAPIDPAAPMRWSGASVDPSDPQLPEGVEPLNKYVTAPPEMVRRLAQIGLVERQDGPRLAALLKTGQRLVSREGDLWRWDGFAAAAHAPTAAARRLGQRNRLTDIERELATARAEVETKRARVTAADADLKAAITAETEARTQRREAQSRADAAREQHANAEREANRTTARLSALSEAKVRLVESRDEAEAMKREAIDALAALQPVAMLEGELAEVRGEVTAKRAALAEVRGEAQSLAREIEIRQRRAQAIEAERRQWQQRQSSAQEQLSALDARIAEATTERTGL
ncbi:MAG TPA: chromosome segregation SMC family protein, partial [Xanthobacteraceae bacterium]|nr:chromosome segregation SMC family protein [Xanthobacteraceae bacterium]